MFLYGSTALDAYALLAQALKERYDIDRLPPMERAPGGKPLFPDYPNLHFSVSHSGRFALCAVAQTPVGADIEQIKPRRGGLPQYALSAEEFSYYRKCGCRVEDFYALWTMKEARCKRSGEGLVRPRAVAVPLPPETLRDGLLFCTYGGVDFRAAVCGGDGSAEICWR